MIGFKPIETEWQPIETAPKDGDDFLALVEYEDGSNAIAIMHWSDGFRISGFPKQDEVTRWMRIPPAPTVAEIAEACDAETKSRTALNYLAERGYALIDVAETGRGGMRSLTYIRRWGFSINEGRFPNIHVSWRFGYFYIALSKKLKWWWGPKWM